MSYFVVRYAYFSCMSHLQDFTMFEHKFNNTWNVNPVFRKCVFMCLSGRVTKIDPWRYMYCDKVITNRHHAWPSALCCVRGHRALGYGWLMQSFLPICSCLVACTPWTSTGCPHTPVMITFYRIDADLRIDLQVCGSPLPLPLAFCGKAISLKGAKRSSPFRWNAARRAFSDPLVGRETSD